MPTILRPLHADITTLKVDAIVNAAAPELLGGGGVDGAIHRAAGPELLAECRLLNGCVTGEAKVTQGYRLPARFVIHTVGPVWYGGQADEAGLLRRCYLNALQLALDMHAKTLAFPCISTGIYGYPFTAAATIAVQTAKAFCAEHRGLEEIIFCCFSSEDFKRYEALLHAD
jgi:O-acetyl-ADP-ribose deacetylase (regulator of RNase III)